MTTVQWSNVFVTSKRKEIVLEALRYCAVNKGLNIYAYCVMNTHLHFLVSTEEPYILKDTIRDFKKFVAKKMIDQLLRENLLESKELLEIYRFEAMRSAKHKDYKFWKAGNHAIEVYSEKFAWIKINYIHNNPVEAGYVSFPYDWKYSSASNYYDRQVLLEEVVVLGPMIR